MRVTEQNCQTPVFDDALEARQKEREQKAVAREQNRLMFQANFPAVSAFAQSVKNRFGQKVRIVWAIENGTYVGKIPDTHRSRHEKDYGQLRPLWGRDADHSDNH